MNFVKWFPAMNHINIESNYPHRIYNNYPDGNGDTIGVN